METKIIEFANFLGYDERDLEQKDGCVRCRSIYYGGDLSIEDNFIRRTTATFDRFEDKIITDQFYDINTFKEVKELSVTY